jgi:hypothetical protein
MKITPVTSQPVAWSEGAAKTRLRVAVCTLLHLAVVIAGLGVTHWAPDLFADVPHGRVFALALGAGPILLAGVGYPALYLLALHGLLRTLRVRASSHPVDGPNT